MTDSPVANIVSSASGEREQGTTITAGETLAKIREFTREFPAPPRNPFSFRYEMPVIESPYLSPEREEIVGHELIELKAHPVAAFLLRLWGCSDHVMYLKGNPIKRMVAAPVYKLNTFRPMMIGPVGLTRMIGAAV